MRLTFVARTLPPVIGALVLGSVSAQENDPPQPYDLSSAAASEMVGDSEHPASLQRLLKGIDANNDGIRDNIAQRAASDNIVTAPVAASSNVAAELEAAFANVGASRPAPMRQGCAEFLLMQPKDQAAANRYVQARTHGVFGTHPCDPVVSPLLERPFETDVAQLHLGPMQLNFAQHD